MLFVVQSPDENSTVDKFVSSASSWLVDDTAVAIKIFFKCLS